MLGLLLLALPQMYGVGYPVMYKTTAGQYALWFVIVLAFAKIAATSLSIGIGGSGGVFAPSLFIGVTSGMAFGDVVHHAFGASAGDPALYAVVAMGAVFASAARAPLTSLASVVEMTGDFALTLPVMLAVAVASITSRALSYGTIYTTKLLRRGTDIDRTAPWRALSDLKVAAAMRPLHPSLPVPPADGDGDGTEPARDWAAIAGPVVYQGDPQALFATESLAQALRQLEIYGHDGLPVLSADGRQVQGWITAPGVLRAIARQISTTRAETAQAQLSADREHADPAALQQPPTPLPGYGFTEISITAGSPAAGRKLGDVAWPPGSVPVSVLRGRQLRPPRPDITLVHGDRVSLLASGEQSAVRFSTCPGQNLSMPDLRSPEMVPPPAQTTGDELVDTVLAASRALVAVAARSLAAAGDDVTLPQYRALVVLASHGPQGTAELAAALAVNPSTATRMCDRLVRKGLVRRHRQAGDRRAVRIALTPAGRDLVAEVTRQRRAELSRLLGALPAEQHEPVIAAFRAFAAAAGELPQPGAALGWAGP